MSEDLHFEHNSPVPVYDVNNGENLADFKYSQFYINNTNVDVAVVLRNNLSVLVEKSSGGYSSGKSFVVRTVYHFNTRNRIVNTINSIQEYKRHYVRVHEELDILLEILLKTFSSNRDTRMSIIAIDRKIDVGLLKEHGRIYVPDADLMLHYGNFDMTHPHPFSVEGQSMARYQELIKNQKTTGVFVELIDNENNIRNRYMYVAKQFMEIPVHRDKNRPSGVYFTKAEHTRAGEVQLDPQVYSFDEAELELGLFKTKEEAMSGGDPEQIFKNEYQQKEKELLEIKQEAERLKGENKLQEYQRTEQVAKLKHQQELDQMELRKTIVSLDQELEEHKRLSSKLKEELDAKKIIRNDYYEQRSHERKDTTEIIKFLPGVVLGALGAFALLRNKS